MYGLPGQTLQMACDDLAMGLSLGVGHLSLYQLTIEPNTVFSPTSRRCCRKPI